MRKTLRKMISAITATLYLLTVMPIQTAFAAANPEVTWTKTYSWRTDTCRTLHVAMTVTDNTVYPRPIDVVILRDVSGSVADSYGGQTINSWFNSGCTQLIEKLFAIPYVDMKIGSVKWSGNPDHTGTDADATVLLNLVASGSKASLESATNNVGTIDTTSTTNLQAAFDKGYTMLFGSSYGARTNSIKVCIVVTDGYPTINNSHCYDEGIALSPGNQFISSAASVANSIKSAGGIVMYWGMTGGLNGSTEVARSVETMQATASDDINGNQMVYCTTAYSSGNITSAVNAINATMTSLRSIIITDTLTSQAITNGFFQNNESSGITKSSDGKSMICTWQPTAAGTWTGSYDITIPLSSLTTGYINFPASSMSVKSYSSRGVLYSDAGTTSNITLPSTLSTSNPTVSGNADSGNTLTFSITASGGAPPYTVTWTRNTDGWTGTGLSVSVVSCGTATYTATVKDAQGCKIVKTLSVTGWVNPSATPVPSPSPTPSTSATPTPTPTATPVPTPTPTSGGGGFSMCTLEEWHTPSYVVVNGPLDFYLKPNAPWDADDAVVYLSLRIQLGWYDSEGVLHGGGDWYNSKDWYGPWYWHSNYGVFKPGWPLGTAPSAECVLYVLATLVDVHGDMQTQGETIIVHAANHPPSVSLTSDKPSYLEGDTAVFSSLCTDPDGDTMTVTMTGQDMGPLGISPGAVTTLYSGTVPSGSTVRYTLPGMIPHPYKVRVTATDTGGLSDSRSLTVVTAPRPIDGMVKHTDNWEKNRLAYNAWVQKTGKSTARSGTVFFRGEKFVLTALTSRYLQSNYVHVHIVEHPELATDMSSVDGWNWTGEIPGTSMRYWSAQPLTFIFENKYIDGTVTTDTVVVTIDTEEYYRIRQLY